MGREWDGTGRAIKVVKVTSSGIVIHDSLKGRDWTDFVIDHTVQNGGKLVNILAFSPFLAFVSFPQKTKLFVP